jgi:hypothetical protein
LTAEDLRELVSDQSGIAEPLDKSNHPFPRQPMPLAASQPTSELTLQANRRQEAVIATALHPDARRA